MRCSELFLNAYVIVFWGVCVEVLTLLIVSIQAQTLLIMSILLLHIVTIQSLSTLSNKQRNTPFGKPYSVFSLFSPSLASSWFSPSAWFAGGTRILAVMSYA